ncbi:unnamed protein product [Larinioides sclopetarius]|uniref:BPL/LPL catalytic domain-containing protein n=1 Tax=Larinioides sclopetarius TaxID=280406 RepID=A0AAV2ASU7_9ARAC
MFSSKISKLHIINIFRCLSITSKKIEVTNVRKNSFNIDGHNSVMISQSHDIFQNLALEDWLYTNIDFSTTNFSILLMWYNRPSIVIGRHQNPWIECSVDFCEANGINIARRNSGGGTVYHDFGNLNLSFLTSRKDYNRKRNLELICESINRKWNINLNISKRHDILYNDQYKEGVESKATSSIRAEIINLKSVCSDIDILKVIEALKSYYKQMYEVQDDHVFCIHPDEDIFPGINQIQEELKSWQWRFGHTPKFSITKSFQIETKGLASSVEIIMNINKGKIESISLDPQILKDQSYDALKQCIVNNRFSFLIDNSLSAWMHYCEDKIICQIVKHNILQMILDLLR